MEEFSTVVEKMYRELQYKIHCELNKEQIKELEEKAERGIEFFKQDKWSFPYSKGTICDMIYQITREKVHYTKIQRLEKEFGGVLSERK